MKTQSIVLFCALVLEVIGKDPQVYENVDDQVQVESNTRVVREPNPHLYKPQAFNFRAAQQDQRRYRYAQQQRADMLNILRKEANTNQEAPLRVSLVQNWKVVEPTVSSSTIIEQKYPLPGNKNGTSVWNTVSLLSTTKKPVTSRKLKPSSYYDDLDNKTKRQDDNQVVYVKRADYDFNALNALVGQNPNNQLEGLKRLLESSQTHFVLPPIKGPLPSSKPIAEDIQDIPNPNTHPNIDTSVSLDNLQARLDEATKSQFAKALAQAQKDALAHVEAQHRAIARAQEEAQKKALAQIALHNQGIKAQQLPQPLALALKQEVVPANLYAPTHTHTGQSKGLVKAQTKANLKVTQAHQSPNAYQQVVLETHQKRQTLYPGVDQLKVPDNVDEHQYAARYAFGYKIRDVKMGNEFGHEEKRDGENAKGFYHVLLPDGRMQKVEYYADPSGYHAKVSYENVAHH